MDKYSNSSLNSVAWFLQYIYQNKIHYIQEFFKEQNITYIDQISNVALSAYWSYGIPDQEFHFIWWQLEIYDPDALLSKASLEQVLIEKFPTLGKNLFSTIE